MVWCAPLSRRHTGALMTSFNAQSLGKTVEAHDVTRESSVIGVPIHKTALNNNNN
jgi:hypothetical protein